MVQFLEDVIFAWADPSKLTQPEKYCQYMYRPAYARGEEIIIFQHLVLETFSYIFGRLYTVGVGPTSHDRSGMNRA